jgi:hypothetical protein
MNEVRYEGFTYLSNDDIIDKWNMKYIYLSSMHKSTKRKICRQIQYKQKQRLCRKTNEKKTRDISFSDYTGGEEGTSKKFISSYADV